MNRFVVVVQQAGYANSQQKMASPPLLPQSLGLLVDTGMVQVYAGARACRKTLVFETDTSVVVIHGQLYLSDDSVRKRLQEVEGADPETPRLEFAVKDFMTEVEGEYLVLLVRKGEPTCFVFNDALGRLPLFTGRYEGRTVFARSVTDAHAFVPDRVVNRYALASRLLLDYPLDDCTEVEGIRSVPGGSLSTWFRGEACGGRILVQYRFDEEASGRDRRELAQEMSQLLIDACRVRLDSCENGGGLLTLSGGLDSRVVACALAHSGRRFTAVTRSNYTSEKDDPVIARKVAEALGIPHLVFQLPPASPDDVRGTVAAGGGGLTLDLAPLVTFLRTVRENVGEDQLLFTGDGGDKTLAPLLPDDAGDSLVLLANPIIGEPSAGEYAASSEITGIRPVDFREYVLQALRAQPESTARGKRRALFFRQRVRRWLNLGEDRNRLVYWCTTPFYSPRFFALASRVPDRSKLGDMFYRDVLSCLDPKCASLPRAGSSRWHRVKMAGYQQMARNRLLLNQYRRARLFLHGERQFEGPPAIVPFVLEYLRNGYLASSPLGSLNIEAMAETIRRSPRSRLTYRLLSLLFAFNPGLLAAGPFGELDRDEQA